MTKRLLIIGAGGHGKVVADTAENMRCWDEIAFVDEQFKQGLTQILHWPVLGSNEFLSQLNPQNNDVAIGIGNNAIRARVFQDVKRLGFELPNIIHPSAYISLHCQLGIASVFFAQSVVNINTKIGNACIINTASSIDHDCQIEDFCHISPGAHLAGGTTVGTLSWLGIGSCTRQLTQIGSNCVIGAGAAVVQNVYNDSIVMGVPARLKS